LRYRFFEAPVTDDLDLLLDQLDSLDDEDIWLLGDAWSQENEEARRRAWAHAKKAIDAGGRGDELDDARHEVSRWMNASRTDFHGIQGLLGQAGGTVGGRHAAAPAIIDAAAAILAGGTLPAEDEDVLMAPWRALEAATADGERATGAEGFDGAERADESTDAERADEGTDAAAGDQSSARAGVARCAAASAGSDRPMERGA
jgi:hypothetical protein